MAQHWAQGALPRCSPSRHEAVRHRRGRSCRCATVDCPASPRGHQLRPRAGRAQGPGPERQDERVHGCDRTRHARGFRSVLATRREVCARLTEIAEQDDRTEPPARAGQPPWQCFPDQGRRTEDVQGDARCIGQPRGCSKDPLSPGATSNIGLRAARRPTAAGNRRSNRAHPVPSRLR